MENLLKLKPLAYANLQRVVEISKRGKFDIQIETFENPTLRANLPFLEKLFGFNAKEEGSLIIELNMLPFSMLDISIKGAGESILKNAYEKLNLSLKDVNIILNVAKTIANIDNSEIKAEHIAEAIQYRLK